ncbi:hypothetical protein XENORESO_008031 [Xenotaenia resolanae]|uniref:Interleukin 6 receptor n=1 Tax=Xenotaenia resolanae TaxID=208358 RepID=A0ABV0VYL9_9TELE
MEEPLLKMRILLLLLCFLCVLQVCCIFDGVCPRKEPPPGVLVVSPGSRLKLTCRGHVKVNGVKVTLTRNIPSTNKRRSPSDRTPTTQQVRRDRAFSNKSGGTSPVSERYHAPTTVTGVSTVPGGNQSVGYSDTEHTTSPQVVQPTPQSITTTGGESDWEDKEKTLELQYKDEVWEEGSSVTKGIKMRPQWKWNKQPVQSADRDWGDIAFLGDGSSLSLSSVKLTDAGKYTCHYRGEEKFAVKVIVADPPETPSIFCYTKSPWSKIRCEWRPQNPVIKHPDCYLFLSKNHRSLRKIENFKQIQCSYTSQRSLCWCALEQHEDEQRSVHVAFLCVTNFLGNTTSPPIQFTPLDILKPDPPSNVSAHPVENIEGMIKVTWNLPVTWKKQDNFYDIIYEIRYRPLTSSNEQVNVIGKRHYTITDALLGSEYLIKLRTKEEYDGHWSEWTSPISARSWTANVAEDGDLTTTIVDLPYIEDFGSGFPDDNYLDGTTNEICTNSEVSCQQYHVLWISAFFVVMSVLLAVYIFRHKSRLMSKLHSLSAITQSDDFSPPPPSIPSAPEGEVLVSGSGPQLYKQRPPSDTQQQEENEEQQTDMDRLEVRNFNNKSYFFLQMEL